MKTPRANQLATTPTPRRTAKIRARPAHREVSASPLPSGELDLIRRFQAGDRAAGAALLRRYEGFIVSIAHHYQGRGLDVPDLLQEGRAGFLRGAMGFDVTRGTTLTTYAGDWVRAKIGRALSDTGRTVRLPVGFIDKLARARRLGISTVEGMVAAGITDRERALGGLAACRPTRSLHVPLIHGGDALGDLLPAAGPSPEDLAAQHEREAEAKATVGRLLDRLTPRERAIVLARAGAVDGGEMTLTDIGRKLGVTRERVRQIETAAMAKLRRAAVASGLRRATT